MPVEGRKRFRGTLLGTQGNATALRRDDAAEGEAAEVLLNIDHMDDAKLVLTDELVTAALRREKAADRAAREARRQERREAKQQRHRPRGPAANSRRIRYGR